MLEARLHADNAFVTLTYSDDCLPLTSRDLATLEPRDLQNWLKRLRKAISPSKVRFYAVGEYGDENFRPHYHAALFGFPGCQFGRTRQHVDQCCLRCELVRSTWGKGKVDLGTLELSSAQYVAGYVTKKMVRNDDPRLAGRWPEFSRMSLKPGIGGDAVWDAASTWMQFDLDTREDDVPSSLQMGGRSFPLGRYLRKRWRKVLGKEEKTPEHTITKLEAPLRQLYEDQKDRKGFVSLKHSLVESKEGARASQRAKSKIFKQRKSL